MITLPNCLLSNSLVSLSLPLWPKLFFFFFSFHHTNEDQHVGSDFMLCVFFFRPFTCFTICHREKLWKASAPSALFGRRLCLFTAIKPKFENDCDNEDWWCFKCSELHSYHTVNEILVTSFGSDWGNVHFLKWISLPWSQNSNWWWYQAFSVEHREWIENKSSALLYIFRMYSFLYIRVYNLLIKCRVSLDLKPFHTACLSLSFLVSCTAGESRFISRCTVRCTFCYHRNKWNIELCSPLKS